MKIIEFNTTKGIYNFELQEINTQFHAHPAIEILYAVSGSFILETNTEKHEHISLAVLDKNVIHKVSSNDNCDIKLLMIECEDPLFRKFLDECDVELNKGVFVEQTFKEKPKLVKLILEYYRGHIVKKSSNKRVNECLQYFDHSNLEYKEMIKILMRKVNLSESRLSHIFKADIGISLKKFLVWSRLKRAFQLIVDDNINLYEASIQSGFYDQAHLSKAFKQMLGLSPSEMYNSRTIQDR